MSIKGRRVVLAAGVLGVLLGSSAALAQHGGGGHGGGGGGGHAMGGGGGGGHAMGGGGGGGHASGGHIGGAGGGHYAGGAHFAAGGVHYAAQGGARGYGGGVAHAYAGGGTRGGAYGARGYGYPGGYGRGYSTGAYWGGGYWRGGYWPRAYYGYGYSWFLPVLPLAYATYWYGGVPYYYANDVYYTWNPDYSGYTASDPPPVADSITAGADTGAVAPPNTDMSTGAQQGQGAPDPQQASPPPQGDTSQLFMYPKNGQSQEQQSTDKQECQKWASDQVGLGSNGPDYRRALMACVQGRGYSAN